MSVVEPSRRAHGPGSEPEPAGEPGPEATRMARPRRLAAMTWTATASLRPGPRAAVPPRLGLAARDRGGLRVLGAGGPAVRASQCAGLGLR